MAAILLVDDEVPLRQSMAISLRRGGHLVAESGSRAEAMAALDHDVFDLVLVDLRLPDGDGLTLLRELRDQALDIVALVVTAFGTIETAVEAMRLGAYDFLQKPFVPERLEACVQRALEHRRLRAELRRRTDVIPRTADPTAALVGASAAMGEVRRAVRQAAAARVVLITGETGTGKDLAARAVHAAAGDPDSPFVTVHCAGLPESLVESELFGHVRGAFTGASLARRGLFAEAEGGTLFLDEIGDVPPAMQVRLLRFLESGEVRAVGADHTSRVDCRIVAATHRDLGLAVREGRFRQDVLYRLDVFRITIPPLRERLEDIEPLTECFFDRIARRLRRAPLRLEPGAIDAMRAWSWPGNVRELEHSLERAALLTEGAELPVDLVVPEPALETVPPQDGSTSAPLRSMADVERDHILAVLTHLGDVVVFGQPPGDQVAFDEWTVDQIGAAGFAQLALRRAGGRLRISPGVRIEPQVTMGNRLLPPASGGVDTGYSRMDLALDPRVSVEFDALPDVVLNSSFGRYQQPADPQDASAVFGAPDLDGSRAVHAVLGGTWRATRTASAEVAAFYKRATGLTARSASPSPPVARALEDGGEGRSYGSQITLRQSRWRNLSGWVSYAIIRSERRDRSGEDWRLFDLDQTHSLVTVAAWQISPRWEVGTRLRVSTGYPRTPVVDAYYEARSDRFHPVFGEHNGERLPAFAQLDLRAEYARPLGPVRWSSYLEVLNVTNRDNAEEVVYSHDFGERDYLTGLPLVVVLGMRGEF